MNYAKLSLACGILLLLGTSALLGGCATTGLVRSEKTSNSMQSEDKEIRKLIVQINETGSSLDALMVAGPKDLKKSFDTYTDNVKRLDNDGQRTLKRMDQMKANSKEYFAEWEKQGDSYTNPEIRALSDERRVRLAESYARIPEAGIGIKGAYHAYLTDLKEIQLYLSNDLTPKGQEIMTPVVNKTVQDRESLKASLVPLLAALDAVQADMYGGKK